MTSDYIPFQLSGETFLVPAKAVREILGVQKCTKVPHQTSRVSGVFPWKGRAIPLIDLNAVLPTGKGLPTTKKHSPSLGTADLGRQRTLVIETKEDVIGLSVDEVREVVRLRTGEFRAAHASDALFTSAEVEWSEGVARLLDIEGLVSECFQLG